MKNFRTYNLAKNFYRNGQGLRFKGAIRNQFERASLSIVLNLAEVAFGKAVRKGTKEVLLHRASFVS